MPGFQIFWNGSLNSFSSESLFGDVQVHSALDVFEHDLVIIVNLISLLLVLETSDGLEEDCLVSVLGELNLVRRVVLIRALLVRLDVAVGIDVQKLYFIAILNVGPFSVVKDLLVLSLFVVKLALELLQFLLKTI